MLLTSLLHLNCTWTADSADPPRRFHSLIEPSHNRSFIPGSFSSLFSLADQLGLLRTWAMLIDGDVADEDDRVSAQSGDASVMASSSGASDALWATRCDRSVAVGVAL